MSWKPKEAGWLTLIKLEVPLPPSGELIFDACGGSPAHPIEFCILFRQFEKAKFVTRYSLFIIHHLLPTTYYLLPITYHPLPTTDYLLHFAYDMLNKGFMAHGSRLMVGGPGRAEAGSSGARPGPVLVPHAWALSHAPSTINNRWVNSGIINYP